MQDNANQNKNGSKNESKKKLTAVLLIAFTLIALAGGCWWWYQSLQYVTTDDARISGTIINVSARIPGKIIEVLVKEGDRVKSGQVVARVDPKDVLAQKAQAVSALAAAQAAYDQACAGADHRNEKLLPLIQCKHR